MALHHEPFAEASKGSKVSVESLFRNSLPLYLAVLSNGLIEVHVAE